MSSETGVITASNRGDAIAEALRVLRIERLVLGIHASAFPPGELDAGYGSPHAAGEPWLAFVRELGFNTLQMGPGGQISDDNPSPYDGTVFSRNALCLDLAALCEPESGALLERRAVAHALSLDPPQSERAQPMRARAIVNRMVDRAHARLQQLRVEQPEHPIRRAVAEFRAGAQPWFELDAVYEVLAERTGCDDPRRFEPALRALFERSSEAAIRRRQVALGLAAAIERVALTQTLLDTQARRFRHRANAHGLELFADLQVGWSTRDRFLQPELFAPRWLLGAPPSRTNPAGQPWGYPLLDPDQRGDPDSPARRAFALQLKLAFATHDGLRIDHPHGLVCPWIYPAAAQDPQRAVQLGVRAFESPDSDDPELQRWAIARVADLDFQQARFADGWVRALDEAQISRYALLFDCVLQVAAEHGRGRAALAVELLSTCPEPLRAVLARHGLGRFVVTQKAQVADPLDVYRTDRAVAADWVMLGNHDTPSILTAADGWLRDGSARARAEYLAARLEPDPAARTAVTERYCGSAHALVQAHLADLFLGPARNVFVYFTDLFGEREPFNRAGVVHRDNWSLRLPRDYAALYARRLAEGFALDLNAALRMALRARGASASLLASL
jgi:4-alpha-glucanotransferase